MPFEFDILYFIQEHIANPVLDNIMVLASVLGEYGFIWIAVALCFLFSKKTRVCGVLMLCSLVLCLVTGEFIIKNLVCRIRPCYQDMAVNLLVERPDSYSFPSGHTASSFTASTTLFYFNKKLGVVALLLAGLIAFSRMYLFVHFPTDVLAGILLGIAGATVVLLIYKKFFKPKSETLA